MKRKQKKTTTCFWVKSQKLWVLFISSPVYSELWKKYSILVLDCQVRKTPPTDKGVVVPRRVIRGVLMQKDSLSRRIFYFRNIPPDSGSPSELWYNLMVRIEAKPSTKEMGDPNEGERVMGMDGSVGSRSGLYRSRSGHGQRNP